MTAMTKRAEIELPSILVTKEDKRRLSGLANSGMERFPRVADFLAREMERASIVPDDADMRGVVRMGSQVDYRDDDSGEAREVVLVYPHDADISRKRISVLTPVGAALIGLSVGQTIQFQTPDRRTRALTVLRVSQ